MVLPAGRLREPVSALRRADVVVITRSVQAPSPAVGGNCPAPHAEPDFLRHDANSKCSSRSATRRWNCRSQDWTTRTFHGLLRHRKSRRISRRFAQVGISGCWRPEASPIITSTRQGEIAELEIGRSKLRRRRSAVHGKRCVEPSQCSVDEIARVLLPHIASTAGRFHGCRLGQAMRPAQSGSGAMKILVRAPNWVGDAVMAIPALRSHSEFAPATPKSAILARPAVADLFTGQPFVDRMMRIRFSRHSSRLAGARKADSAQLRGEKFDCADAASKCV